MLETKQTTKRYGKQIAVDHVSLRVPRGSVYGLLGPNGAGKTTMLKMVVGLLRPSSCEIAVFGEPWQRRHLERIGALIDASAIYGYGNL